MSVRNRLLEIGAMIYTVTLNPSVDRTLTIEGFQVGGTFKASRVNLLPAGKGINVARVVATLGEPVVALGLVGEGEGGAFAAELASAGITDRLTRVPGATRASVTVLDPVGHTETHLREPGVEPPANALVRIEAELERAAEGDWVILAGSLRPGLQDTTYSALIRLCAARKANTLLDASGPGLLAGLDSRPTVLKLNLLELWQVHAGTASERAGRDLGSLSVPQVVLLARQVQARGIPMVVVSMGQRGALGLDRQRGAWHAQVSLDRQAIDTVGSGDALGAGWTVAWTWGLPFMEALKWGVACGAANTLVPGAGRCCKEDVERLVAAATARAVC
jgi:tagatose 6-phosphate kinase